MCVCARAQLCDRHADDRAVRAQAEALHRRARRAHLVPHVRRRRARFSRALRSHTYTHTPLSRPCCNSSCALILPVRTGWIRSASAFFPRVPCFPPFVATGLTRACLFSPDAMWMRACVRACATQDVLNFLVFHVFLTYVHYSRETVRRCRFRSARPFNDLSGACVYVCVCVLTRVARVFFRGRFIRSFCWPAPALAFAFARARGARAGGAQAVHPPRPAQDPVPRDAEGAGERTPRVRLEAPLDLVSPHAVLAPSPSPTAAAPPSTAFPVLVVRLLTRGCRLCCRYVFHDESLFLSLPVLRRPSPSTFPSTFPFLRRSAPPRSRSVRLSYAVVRPDAFCARRYRSACRLIQLVSSLWLWLFSLFWLWLWLWLWRARTRDADRLVCGRVVLATQNMEASGVVPKAQEIEFKALEGSLSMMSKGARIRVFRPRFCFRSSFIVHSVIRTTPVPLRARSAERRA